VMVTGDHPETAMIYARKLGIAKEGDKPITGKDFTRLGDKIDELIPITNVFARVAPEHKLRIVNVLQKAGNVVAMTGDGVNDAPALKKADIGVSMGITGCEVAKDSASLILTDDSFSTIVSAVYEGRVIFDNIKKFIWYMLGANIGEVFLIFLALILGYPPPLIAIQLLWINLLTDSLPGLALGVEPAEAGIMDRKPRDPKQKLISGSFLLDMIFRGIVMGTVVFIAFLIGNSTPAGYSMGITYAFSTIVVSELVLAYSCRSFKKTMFELNPLSNPQILGAIAISFILFLVTFAFPGIFKAIPLGFKDIGIVVGLGVIPALTVDAWKLIKRFAKRK
ncbi:MAG: cation-transporting P-type ATPase, partial [Caldisericia bacterium]|nr:cation-transporting P-type ATPase [Caldisericia bacterium]